jgi:dTDP-4-dehydrorhamnose reductase
MVLLIGHGYIGTAFAQELHLRKISFAWESHEFYNGIDGNEKLVINCAAFIPYPSVSECDKNPRETFNANAALPLLLARSCSVQGVPFMHISTGCLFDEEVDYGEHDVPKRSRFGHCGVYIDSKLTGEKFVSDACRNHYILRIRLPFGKFDHPRNFLSKLALHDPLHDTIDSLSHRGDIAKAALDLWEKRAPFGTYHVANEGSIPKREVVSMMMKGGIIKTYPQFIKGPAPGSRLSVAKLLSTGVKIRPVQEALEDAIKNWKPCIEK